MLNALYELGKLWIDKENLDKFEILLDAGKLNKRTKSVVIVEFNLENGVYTFNNVFEKEYDSTDIGKYLYKSGSSRGTDISPSCIITDPEKTFQNKFFKWFKDYKNEDELILNLFNVIEKDKNKIFNHINEIYNSLDDKTNALLSILINDGEDKYVGNFEIFKNILLEKSSEKYYKKNSKKIKGESQCFLCDEEKEVFGLVSSSIGFAFSTPEKVGNVQEHNIMNQWKQLPICGDCALYLEAGKKFVEKYLSFSEFGLRYYAIPNFLFDYENGFNSIYKYIKRNENEYTYQKYILSKEDKFVSLVDNLNDVLEFKFLYYESNNNAFNILAYVESVLPSWLHELYDAQLTISTLPIFSEDIMKNVFGEKVEGNLIDVINSKNDKFKLSQVNWYLSFLRGFYPNKFYRDTATSILSHKKIDYNFLLSNIIKEVQKWWRQSNEYMVKMSTLKSLSLILLFDYLGLIKGENIMKLKLNNDGYVEDYSQILEDILDSSDKKVCFLVGILTKKLATIQYVNLGSSPFLNKLWGLSLDEHKIKKTYDMVVGKLNDYDSLYYYNDLQNKICVNFFEAENNWNLTKDECTHYFILGYTLGFNKKEENKGDNDE